MIFWVYLNIRSGICLVSRVGGYDCRLQSILEKITVIYVKSEVYTTYTMM
jgi:hypothetical protein